MEGGFTFLKPGRIRSWNRCSGDTLRLVGRERWASFGISIWTSEIFTGSFRGMLVVSTSPRSDYIALLTLSSMYLATLFIYENPTLSSCTPSSVSPSHNRSRHHSQILPINRTQVYKITKAPRQYRQLPSLVLCRRFDDSFG